jgi:hypothetical protein
MTKVRTRSAKRRLPDSKRIILEFLELEILGKKKKRKNEEISKK